MVALGLAGTLAAAYLAFTKLAGEVPACGPLLGCETVNSSPYAEFMGIPIALFGVALSLAITVAAAIWGRAGDGRALAVAYVLGLVGVFAVAYLTYLELFVIRAICAWCVAYALTVVAGWLVAGFGIRSGPQPPVADPSR